MPVKSVEIVRFVLIVEIVSFDQIILLVLNGQRY